MASDRPKQHAWRTAGAHSASIEPGKSRRGGGKRYFVLAIALAIVGVTVGILTWPIQGAKPIFLGIPVTQYDHRAYPPNPWAQADGEALRSRFEIDSALAAQAQEKNAIVDQVTSLADRTGEAKDKGRPVVLYLNAFATVLGGKVQVLPGRADPDNASSWLPLAEILSALRRGSGSRLLLLDLAQPIAEAHLGIIANNLSGALDQELTAADQAGDLNFLVLASCGPGQASHVSLELQRSVFGFFLEQGLLGHADGWNDKKQTNGQVTAMELVQYTIAQAADWADQHHLSPQTPKLYGKDKDFLLISPRAPFPSVKLPEPPGEYPKFLAEGWKNRDAWIGDNSYRRLPRTFHELEWILLRAERQWLAGDSDDRIHLDFDGKYNDLKKQKEDTSPRKIEPRSIAEARWLAAKDDTAIVNQVRVILGRSPLKPDDLKPLVEKPPEPPPFASISHGLLEALIEPADPPPELLKNASELLKSLAPPSHLIELAAVRLVIGLDPRAQAKWSEPALLGVRRLVLTTARDAEVAAAVDPRVLPWIRSDLSAADSARRNGVLHLATGGMDDRAQGLMELTTASKKYESVKKIAQELQRGFQRLEEARALLPNLIAPLGNRVPDSADKELWASLIASTSKLQKVLTPPNANESLDLDDLVATTDRIQSDLARIRRSYEPAELDRFLRRAGQPNGPSPAEVRRLLDSAIWSGPDRARIYDSAKQQGQTVSAQAISHGAGLAPGAAAPATNEHYPDAPAWRAKLAIDFLKLDGVTKTETLQESMNRAEKSDRAEDWLELGRQIRKAWAVNLVDRYKDSPDLLLRERAGYVIHPADLDAIREPDQRYPGEPEIELRKNQARGYWQWLARERYLNDADLFLAVKNRPDLNDYGKALKNVGLELQARAP